MSASNLSAWDVDASDFPTAGSLEQKIRFAVRHAILAPSSHNTQPWRFMIAGGELLLCADRLRSLPVIDPFDRELVISCGAALFNLRVVFSHFWIPIEISTFPQPSDPDVLARIAFPRSGPLLADIGQLFETIRHRVTNRQSFVEEALPQALIEDMRSAASMEGTDINLVRSSADRERIASLVAEADLHQFKDPHFRRELANWIHPSRSFDGMPAYSQGVQLLTETARPIAAMVIRSFDVGNGVAAAHKQLARASPLLVVLSTAIDNGEAWLAAGQALQRILLVAAKAGYSASYLNQPIEVPEVRMRLATQMNAGRYPQLLLRVGRGPPQPHSPRRTLADVLS